MEDLNPERLEVQESMKKLVIVSKTPSRIKIALGLFVVSIGLLPFFLHSPLVLGGLVLIALASLVVLLKWWYGPTLDKGKNRKHGPTT